MADVRFQVQCDPALHEHEILLDPKIKSKSVEPMEAKTLPSMLALVAPRVPVTEFPENPVTLLIKCVIPALPFTEAMKKMKKPQ